MKGFEERLFIICYNFGSVQRMPRFHTFFWPVQKIFRFLYTFAKISGVSRKCRAFTPFFGQFKKYFALFIHEKFGRKAGRVGVQKMPRFHSFFGQFKKY